MPNGWGARRLTYQSLIVTCHALPRGRHRARRSYNAAPMASIIDGAGLAKQIREGVKARVGELTAAGRRVHLVAILVGSTPAGELYAQRQKETCATVGIEYDLVTLPADATFDDVAATIDRLNKDIAVTGVMLHLPLPKHLDATELQYQIDPVKDVEG